jgi:hypothetical protein
VNFYEVMANGYHSPLTKTQIAELFHAGRLGRHHRCKQVANKEWRTIDELFPLLKYQSSGPAVYESTEPRGPSPRIWSVVLLFLAAACAAAIVWFYFAHDAGAPSQRANVTVHNWPRTITSAAPPAPTVFPQEPTNYAVATLPATTDASSQVITSQQAQLAREQKEAEQRQREQSRAERARLTAESAERERKAAGQDIIIALDRESIVNVGGITVTVRIHDNDVTSFDVWINGRRRHEVPKEKGITGTRTDETMIHANGRARLYYVWEPSGKVNHCRLRVRED